MRARSFALFLAIAFVLFAVADASRLRERLALRVKAASVKEQDTSKMTEYLVKTDSGEHIVLLDNSIFDAPANTPAPSPTSAPATTATPTTSPTTSPAPASTTTTKEDPPAQAPSSSNSVTVIAQKTPSGGELFMMYLPFIILALVLLITCALCYLFRDKIPTCVRGIEICCEWTVRIIVWPFRQLWRCFKWCFYPIKECCLDCCFSLYDIFYPSRVKI